MEIIAGIVLLEILRCAKGEAMTVPVMCLIVIGTISWYGNFETGFTTANGETFDPQAYTAASTTLPFGTMVVIKNLDNGRMAPAIITDRMPVKHDRILDVTKALAERLGFVDDGLCRAEVWVLFYDPNKRGKAK